MVIRQWTVRDSEELHINVSVLKALENRNTAHDVQQTLRVLEVWEVRDTSIRANSWIPVLTLRLCAWIVSMCDHRAIR